MTPIRLQIVWILNPLQVVRSLFWNLLQIVRSLFNSTSLDSELEIGQPQGATKSPVQPPSIRDPNKRIGLRLLNSINFRFKQAVRFGAAVVVVSGDLATKLTLNLIHNPQILQIPRTF